MECGHERVQPQPTFGCKLNSVADLESPPLGLPCEGRPGRNSTGLQAFVRTETEIQLLQTNRFRVQQLGTFQRGPSSLDQPYIGSPVANIPSAFPAEATVRGGAQTDERGPPQYAEL